MQYRKTAILNPWKFFDIGNGTADYWFTKPGEDPEKAFLKRGYIRTYEPRNWLVAFSSYDVELRAVVGKFRNSILIIGLVSRMPKSLVLCWTSKNRIRLLGFLVEP
ncbi:MAG: hypothetical protein P1P77_13770, partial [Spirochaetaceae bacterium]|nr:hypothetical protein [Spirochaetaceae bacterium]